MTQKVKKPIPIYFLIFIIFFMAISGIFGGMTFIISPSGELISMPIDILIGSPFNSFFLPGIILFIIIGIYPSFIFFGLLNRKQIKIFSLINIYKEIHWAWTSSIYSGIILILWIDIQIFLIGYNSALQFIYSLIGVITIIFALIPSVKEYYSN